MGFSKDAPDVKDKFTGACPPELEKMSDEARGLMKDWKQCQPQREGYPPLPYCGVITEAEACKREAEHNKKLFDQVDTNHDGRLSLSELDFAIHDPDSKLNVFEIHQLRVEEKIVLANMAAAAPFSFFPGVSDKFGVTLPEFMAKPKVHIDNEVL